MYLIGVLSEKFLLIAIPPNRRVAERARNFRSNLRAAIQQQGYEFAGFTSYPSDDVLMRMRETENRTFASFAEMICRGRLRRIERKHAAEDARDREAVL